MTASKPDLVPEDMSHVALVHRSDCVPVDRPSSTQCEADSYVQSQPCPNVAHLRPPLPRFADKSGLSLSRLH